MQDVVELQTDGERLALQERLRQLRVPYQLVGVGSRVAIAPSARHVQAGGKLHAPRHLHGGVETVVECPRVQVGVLLQGVAVAVVAHAAVQLHLQPVVAVAGSQPLAEGGALGGHLTHVAVAIDVDVAHVVGIAGLRAGVDVEVAGCVDSHIIGHVAVDVPVAVDVLRARGASTRHGVVLHHVGYGVLRGREAQAGKDELVMALEEIVVAPVEALGKRGLQLRITAADVERVGVVRDGQQVAHRGLTGVAAILEAHVAAIAELPAEVGRRAPVNHVAGGHGVDGQVAVGKLARLRDNLHAHVEVIGRADDAQHDFTSMDIVLVLREAALALVVVVGVAAAA